MAARAARKHRTRVKVVVRGTLRFLRVRACELLVAHLQVVASCSSSTAELVYWPRYLVILLVHKLLLVLTDLRLSLGIIFTVASPFLCIKLVITAIPGLINLVHLVLVLLEGSLVVVKHDVFFRAAVLVI